MRLNDNGANDQWELKAQAQKSMKWDRLNFTEKSWDRKENKKKSQLTCKLIIDCLTSLAITQLNRVINDDEIIIIEGTH